MCRHRRLDVVLAIAPCFSAQDGASAIEPQTYLHYIHLRPSLPSQRQWVVYDEQVRAIMLDDFKRLWATGFLDDLSIEVADHTLSNGVTAKLVTYHLEERRRLRAIEYTGSKHLQAGDIDTALKEAKRPLRTDTFLDERDVTHAAAVIRRLLAEKGHLDARVTTSMTTAPGNPRLVNVTVGIDDGPRYQIRRIEFAGNRNELSFGGGMSGIDGIYVHASYGTSNVLGMGETLQVAVQHGARSNLYQVSVTEPYLFGRPISTGASLFTRKVDYYIAADTVGYSEVRTGGTVTGGWLLGRFLRLYGGYGYEVIDTAVRDDLFASSPTSTPGDPVFDPSPDQGRHVESRVTPSLVYNSVDQPLLPRRGMRLSGSYEVAGGLLGGTVDYVRPEGEAVVYLPVPWLKRTALGLRG